MRKLMFAIMLVAAATMGIGCDDDYNAPSATVNDFDNRYPTATHVEWEKKKGRAVAEFELAGEDCEAWYTLGGEWIMTRFDIRYSELPEAVRSSFEQGYGTQTPIDDVERLERNNADTIYYIEATVVVNGYLTDIYLDYLGDGTLLRSSADIENYDYWAYYL